MIKTNFPLLLLVCILALPSCFKIPQYRKKSLTAVNYNFAYKSTENNVHLQVKRLNEDEQYTLFSKRAVWLYDNKSFQPIHPLYISIHNESNTVYAISPRNISLKLTPHHKVAHFIKTSTFGRGAKNFVIGYFASLPILLTAGITNSFAHKHGSAFGFAINASFTGTLFSTLFVTLQSALINTRIRHDLKEKTLHCKKTILPGQQLDFLVFVTHSNYQDGFTVTLNSVKDTLTFTINKL